MDLLLRVHAGVMSLVLVQNQSLNAGMQSSRPLDDRSRCPLAIVTDARAVSSTH